MENKPSFNEILDSIGAIGEMMHLTYESFLNAGFTEKESMELVKTAVGAMFGSSSKPQS